jgi:outer membrane protein TolC
MSGRLRRCAISVLLLLCLAPAARAQTLTSRIEQSQASPPPSPAGTQPLSLTLEDALARGLRENINARLSDAEVTAAKGEHWVSMQDLLPTASAHGSYTRQELSLAAFGFTFPGFPPIIGPFNVHDVRLSVSQALFDLNALYEAKSGAATLQAAELDRRDTRALVALAVRNGYLQTVAAESRMKAARAQADTARALFNQATDLKNAGVVAGIDALRAQVQLRSQEQRAIVAENDYQKRKLQLARAIGLPLGQEFTLGDTIPYAPMQTIALSDALTQALANRDDYKAAEIRLAAADASRQAALADTLPSLHFHADYGAIGGTAGATHSTYSVMTQVRIPLFDASTTRGHVLEADGLVQRRRAELSDFRARVEYEVRTAYLDLRAADEQLQAAQDAVNLANQQLEQTRDRFAAGVAGNIEVVQAQESVATATENYISSLYAHNLAKATLAHAIGGSF